MEAILVIGMLGIAALVHGLWVMAYAIHPARRVEARLRQYAKR